MLLMKRTTEKLGILLGEFHGRNGNNNGKLQNEIGRTYICREFKED